MLPTRYWMYLYKLEVLRKMLKKMQISIKMPDERLYCPVDTLDFILAIAMCKAGYIVPEPFDILVSDIGSPLLLQEEVRIMQYSFRPEQ